ncbi:MAG: L-threonylcarbamoyladenylate synthase [Pseudomonadota bacterium]
MPPISRTLYETPRMTAEPLEAAAARVSAVLLDNGLAAVPTETVYGVCGRASAAEAVGKVFAVKGRPAINPLIVHVADVDTARKLGVLSEAAEALAERFWPGPLTLVVPLADGAAVAPAALAGGTTIALRVPAAPVLRRAAETVGAIVAPSANRSGRVSPTSADAVAEELGGRIDLIVDGGPSPIGVESTVLDMTGPPRLLRPGGLDGAAIEAVIGPLAAGPQAAGGPLRSPGLLSSHYAPRARLRLDVDADGVRPGEAWLAFGAEDGPAEPSRTVRLSPTRDLHEAARNLYAGLRTLDLTGAATIAVSPIPTHGLGAAIRDRLARAAAPRHDDPS